MKISESTSQVRGVLAACVAYVLWGILPVYWKLIDNVSAYEILAQRVIWSFVFMILVMLFTAKLKEFHKDLRQIFAHPKKLLGLIMASILISINWGTYIWAVNNDRILETSLGYYINPLINVLLGILILRERMSFWQIISLFLASLGVLNMALHFGSVPWLSLVLAFTFGLYGLCKKIVAIGAITGIALETLLISPFALLYLGQIHKTGQLAFSLSAPDTVLLLMGAGVVTAVPLILFASGAKNLPLSLVGLLQYISPTMGLFLGVFVYHEAFTSVHKVSFIFIWAALVIFSLAKTKSFMQLEVMLLRKASLKDNKSA